MKKIIWILLSAVLFVFIFYKQRLGLNLIIYEGFILSVFLASGTFRLKTTNARILFAGTLATLIASIVVHSVFSYVMNFIGLLLLVGYMVYPEMRSLSSAAGNSLYNIFVSQGRFFTQFNTRPKQQRFRINRLKRIRIFILPLLIILLFVLIYSAANPVFNDYTRGVGLFLSEHLDFIIEYFNAQMIFLFLFGVVLGNYFFLSRSYSEIEKHQQESTDELQRRRKPLGSHYSLMALKNEYKAGVFLLISLNILLLTLNAIDIKWVWIKFEWEGQFLKEFVHKGTYLLIVSILISIAVVLYFFRGNINFYQKNKTLKILSFVWIAQNAFLVLSVGLRNLYYIQHFALAYKRIGVFIFLILTLYGLFTVWQKVKHRKSRSYLVRVNTLAAFCILSLSALVNWDLHIARYNLKHSDTAFLHLNFMGNLSDKTLPVLDIAEDRLEEIEIKQNKRFAFKQKIRYLGPEEYAEFIKERKKRFIIRWEEQSLLSWNYAEYHAWKQLKE